VAGGIVPGEIATIDEYLDYARRLKPLVQSHAEKKLEARANVVMDFPANTRKQRGWFRQLI
jgi:hypothetical protein